MPTTNRTNYYLIILLFTITTSAIGQDNILYQNLDVGSFSVGFEEKHVTDYSRIYKGDFRNIQVALWFPITNPKGENVKIIDYLMLYNSEDKYEDSVEIKNFWQNQIIQINKNASFETICNANSLAYFETLSKNSKYPLILYAAGGQGESFENMLLCEVIASHGFVVASIPSIGTNIHPIEINKEGLMTQALDLLAVLRHLKENNIVDFNFVGTMGWSWGGLAALYIQTIYPKVETVVSLDGSIAGYSEVLESLPYYSITTVNSPSLYFTTAKETKLRTLNYIEKSIYNDVSFVSFDSIDHSNFNSYHYLSNLYSDSLINSNVIQFYPYLINNVSNYFIAKLNSKTGGSFQFTKPLPFVDTTFHRDGKEPPIREDELITLILEKGAEKGKNEYQKMKRLNPDYIPFQAFELTKVAFRLVRDTIRTDESVKIMEIVINEYPTSASSYALKGRVHEIRGEYKLALSYFKKALEIKGGTNEEIEVVFYEDVKWYKTKIDEMEAITNGD